MTEKQKRIEGLPHLYGFNLLPFQKKWIDSTHSFNLLFAGNQLGKDQPINSTIPTPGGMKKLRDLKIGDKVFDRNGRECNIIGIPFDGYNDIYRVTFNDGTYLDCGPNHEWIAKGPEERFRKTNADYGKWKTFETKKIISHGQYKPSPKSNKTKYSIPITLPVARKAKYLFDPYLVGLLIGDGSYSNGSVTIASVDDEIINYVQDKYFARKAGDCSYRLVGLKKITNAIGLIDSGIDKKIPTDYMKGSIDQRLSLLQGLMDTDGTVDKNGICEFYTISPTLNNQVMSLAHSLGMWASSKIKPSGYKNKDGDYVKCHDCYRIRIKSKAPLFRLKRKLDRQVWTDRYKHERVIDKIEHIGHGRTKCISVDSEDHSYLASENYIVTHNSTSNALKCVTWATSPDLWPSLWDSKPLSFWYMYPDAKTATSEITTKWVNEFLPRGEYKDHPVYGWRFRRQQGHITSIEFNSGVTIFIKYYSMGATALQGASLYALFADEEIPWELVGEIRLRLIAKGGYFHLVCTPTLGQQEWARTIEPEYVGTKEELFKSGEIDILKMRVSMYDCQNYADGTPSHITLNRIKQIEATLDEREIQVRVYGRFMMENGLKYQNFDENYNVTEYHPLSNDKWNYFCGIDWGGGGKSHESGIVVVAVNREYTIARVVYAWISKGEKTTCGDVIDIYRRTILSRFRITRCFYDFSAKDLGTIAERAGLPMEKAEKSHDIGVPLLNTLFKTGALKIMHDWNNTGDTQKLISELKHLLADTKKRNADDTLADSLRYALSKLRFSIDEIIKNSPDIDPTHIQKLKKNTRGYEEQEFTEQLDILIEMEEWDDYHSDDYAY